MANETLSNGPNDGGNGPEGGLVLIDIEQELRRSYLGYAVSTLVSRALPDIRDGFKPVQRRLMYAMRELNIGPNSARVKSARVVGETMGIYHPHGDSSIYGTMVRLAQDFSLRYPLVDGQGNFGCFTGDTKIKLLDGTEKTFAELSTLDPNEIFHVYSVNKSGRVVVGEGRHARVTRRNARLIEVTLDSGEKIRCTPDHRFMIRSGAYKEAQHLTPQDSLMPGYFDAAPVKEGLNEYLRIQQPATGEYEFVHVIADRFEQEKKRRADQRNAGLVPILEQAPPRFTVLDDPLKAGARYNHRIESLQWVEECADVYDITVDEHHNFLLSAGVFVHNSIDADPPAAMRYCVVGDSLVVAKEGLVPIARLSEGSEDIQTEILSLDGVVNTASKWFNCGAFPTRRVQTQKGYEVVGTTNHPLLVCVPGEDKCVQLVWKTIGQIQPGDWVVIDRGQQLWPEQAVDLRPYHPQLPDESRQQRHTLPTELDSDTALLMGCLLAEGTFQPHRAEFTAIEGDFADTFRTTWQSAFPTCRLHTFLRDPVSYGKHPFWQMQIVSLQMVAFLRNLGLTGRSATRNIPDVILRSPKAVAAAFLRGLFEGDGAVERSGRSLLRVSMCARNEAMLKQVQTLLLRFGIVSTRSAEKKRQMHRLCITGRDNLKQYSNEIGFISQTKQEALADVLQKLTGRALAQTDYVPFLAEYVRKKATRHREWLVKNNFDRTARLTAALPRLMEALPPADGQHIQHLAGTHYLFEQVISVEDAGKQNVYSIRVDSDCHSFVANGFVNHNTEARLTPLAMEMMEDIERDTVDWMPNYDQSTREPRVLPGKFPNFICNGGEGIAVGMSTSVPPHNLREVVDALMYVLDHPEATADDLFKFIPGPDFPTAAMILGTKGAREAYRTGRGRVIMQAQLQIEPMDNGKNCIVITELPYQVIKSRLIEHIADLVRHKKVEGITDINDYSDKHGMRVVIELRRDVLPKRIVNFLLKHTSLRQTFGIIMLALVNGQPKLLNLPQVLNLFLAHRKEVIVRRTRYELARAKAAAHIREGLQIALNFLDEIIALIRRSPSTEVARSEMCARFGLTQIQAEAILNMQLRQISQLERQKIEDDYKRLLKEIAFFEDILVTPARVVKIIKEELRGLRDKYGDERRTRILPMEADDITEDDLIPEEKTLVTISRDGYIKRVPVDTYRTQKRGGRGVQAANLKEEDQLAHLFVATTTHYILFFTDRGRIYRLKAYEVPQTSRQARGQHINNFIQVEPGDKITAILPMKDMNAGGFLLLATANGEVKRTSLTEFANLRVNGKKCFDIEEGDSLNWVRHTDGVQEVIMVTRNGMSIRFKEEDVPERGYTAGGVRGIELRDPKTKKIMDAVVSMDVVSPTSQLLVCSEKGFGKRTDLASYRAQSRGGKGLITMNVTTKTGPIVDAAVVEPEDILMVLTESGVAIRMDIKTIRSTGRSTQGVTLIKLGDGNRVATIERLINSEEVEAVANAAAETPEGPNGAGK